MLSANSPDQDVPVPRPGKSKLQKALGAAAVTVALVSPGLGKLLLNDKEGAGSPKEGPEPVLREKVDEVRGEVKKLVPLIEAAVPDSTQTVGAQPPTPPSPEHVTAPTISQEPSKEPSLDEDVPEGTPGGEVHGDDFSLRGRYNPASEPGRGSDVPGFEREEISEEEFGRLSFDDQIELFFSSTKRAGRELPSTDFQHFLKKNINKPGFANALKLGLAQQSYGKDLNADLVEFAKEKIDGISRDKLLGRSYSQSESDIRLLIDSVFLVVPDGLEDDLKKALSVTPRQ